MSLDNIVDIADLDVIYLSYDEPQKEEFWLKIKNMVPWAVRIDSVKGSDAAHKAAAALSETERFITVDADNIVNEDSSKCYSNKFHTTPPRFYQLCSFYIY